MKASLLSIKPLVGMGVFWQSGRSVRGINLLNALYHSGGVSIPVAFELVRKTNLRVRQVADQMVA
jgi:hypothetical protein